MLRHSTGVFAFSFAFVWAAGAASCSSSDHLDFFDPSWPQTQGGQDAASNPSPDAGAGDTARPMAEAGSLDDDGQAPAQPEAASPDAPAPTVDAGPMDPKDASVTVPDANGMEVPDAALAIDVRLDLNLPGFDAGWPLDSGPIGSDCAAVRGVVFKGHCYFVIPPTAWEENACASRGAHLATITSADEQMAVAALAPTQERWVGLRRRNGAPRPAMSFDWVTGEPLSYMNWAVYDNNSREPNDTGDCVRLLDPGTWADSDCSDRFQAICERE
jgi:hypothetical protein